jgi:hypothetical protein
MKRRAILVEGPLAFRMRRLEAARASDIGLEVLTLPLIASRLVGGFAHLADRSLLSTTIAAALDEGGFDELEEVRRLPGMVRAVMQTLDRAWAADLDLEQLAGNSRRLADLALIQRRLQSMLPSGAMLPQDVRDAALKRIGVASILFASIRLERMIDVDPVWRPLLAALAPRIELSWLAVGESDRSWFPGTVTKSEEAASRSVSGDVCADPRAEVVEALRWTRELLCRGNVSASDIAIATAWPGTWDEHMLVLTRDAQLPLHFSHGLPALSTWEGQTCAALADVLTNGLNQDRVRRLLRRIASLSPSLLPGDWGAGLPRRAGLFTVDQWRLALMAARPRRSDPAAAERALLPILELLALGSSQAEEAGKVLLRAGTLGLWQEALRNAPPAAIALSLQDLRIRDERDPGNSVVWCPASHLVGAPRRWIRLLGLNGRAWPRSESEDPLLPNHILDRRKLVPVPISERDRQVFDVLLGDGARKVTLSRSQRSAEGAMLAASALWPPATIARTRTRTRTPDHAFSEADRLLARPREAGQSIAIKATRACWHNWHRSQFTPHDGATRAGHPAAERALTRLHSATSLKRLVRDPLGFLWRYAIGMRAVPLAQQPLSLDPLIFGELVHEVLRRTVDALEPDPGFVQSSHDQIEIALSAALAHIREQWPLERPVPPALLWGHTLDEAARRALRGLTTGRSFQQGTRSWTELQFGSVGVQDARGPWPADREVVLGDERIRLGGRIDRVDVGAAGDRARISDYKTGKTPANADRIVFDGGKELQRVLYAMAVRQMLPEATTVISRLVYLDPNTPPYSLEGHELDAAFVTLAQFLDVACRLVRRGRVCPGPDAEDRYNDLRLALPAERDAYFWRKRASFASASRDLSPLWSER